MNAIIFGANGQDGYYLKELLKQLGIDVIGVSRGGEYLRTDIASFKEVSALIRTHKPAYIFHLAANSTTSHDAIFENNATIGTGTINILEAVKIHSPLSKVFISGSGLQFRNAGRAIKETDPFEARDPYAVSRIHSVYAARYYRTLGIMTYVGYFFNHDSPRRTERHMAKKITGFTNRIHNGSNEKLEIGDTSVIKEWTFAGDVVKAIWTFVQQDKLFEANLGSGVGHSIEDWLGVCFNLIGKDWRQYVILREDYLPEYKKLVSDPTLIFSLGWKPQVSLEELARLMLR